MTERQRSVPRAAGRGALVGCTVAIGMIGVRVLTAMPGYGRTRRGTIALQGFSRTVLRVLGIRVVSRGSPRPGPSLVVANHVCWLDVLVLAAAGPVIPVLDDAVLQRSVTGPMVRRAAALGLAPGVSRDLSAAVQRVTAALRGGHRVLVFPHLRSPGHSAQRFSRAPFQAAVDAAAVISPVALSYRSAPGSPAGPDDVLGSLWPILRTGRLTVRVTWLPVIPAVAGPGHRAGHRDAAARRTEWAIDRALDDRVPAKPAARPPRPLALAS